MVDEIEDIQCKFNDFILSAKTSLSKNIRTKIHNNITQIEKNNFLWYNISTYVNYNYYNII